MILIVRIKFQISLRPNLCEQYSAWWWNDLSANTILVNRERIQRYHPPIPMIYHTAGCGLIFVESTTWMEHFLCIDYMNYLAMFHINFVISIQACTNLTTVIARFFVLPKSRRTVFMAVPGSPCSNWGSSIPAEAFYPLLVRCSKTSQAPLSGPVDGARRLEAPLRRAFRPLNLLLGKLGSCSVRWPGGRRLLAEEMLRCLTGGSTSIVPSFSD